MPSTSNFSPTLAGPGIITADAGRRATKTMTPTAHDVKSPSNEGMKRVRITAVMSYNADKTQSTKYEVQEVQDMHSLGAQPVALEHPSVPAQPSPPLLSARRSPRRFDSVSSMLSDDSPLRTPSPEEVRAYFYPEAEAMWPSNPPGAPRIPFPPTPPARQGPATANGSGAIGLGIGYVDNMYEAQGSIVHEPEMGESHAFDSFVFHPVLYTIEPRYTGYRNVGLGISLDRHALWEESGGGEMTDESPAESDDGDQAYYHLPSGLLSPELTMSTEEFKSSVRKWMERRSGRESRPRDQNEDDDEHTETEA